MDRPLHLANFWELLLSWGGSLVDEVNLWTEDEYVQGYLPHTLPKTLLLVSFCQYFGHTFDNFSKKCLLHLSKYTQNAWRTKYPEEMIEIIHFDIPDGSSVENPAEDAAFFKSIGAKWTDDVLIKFELRNITNGTRFTFEWFKGSEELRAHWTIQRM